MIRHLLLIISLVIISAAAMEEGNEGNFCVGPSKALGSPNNSGQKAEILYPEECKKLGIKKRPKVELDEGNRNKRLKTDSFEIMVLPQEIIERILSFRLITPQHMYVREEKISNLIKKVDDEVEVNKQIEILSALKKTINDAVDEIYTVASFNPIHLINLEADFNMLCLLSTVCKTFREIVSPSIKGGRILYSLTKEFQVRRDFYNRMNKLAQKKLNISFNAHDMYIDLSKINFFEPKHITHLILHPGKTEEEEISISSIEKTKDQKFLKISAAKDFSFSLYKREDIQIFLKPCLFNLQVFFSDNSCNLSNQQLCGFYTNFYCPKPFASRNLANLGNMKHITDLDLSSNAIRKLPQGLGSLVNLKNLNLHGCLLSEISSEIEKLINLRHLNISKNFISNLPPQIGRLVNMICLDISKNSLEKVPQEFGNFKKLDELNLSHNKISEFPQEILKNLESLQILYLSHNELIKAFSCVNMRNLTQIDLSHNKGLTKFPDGCGYNHHFRKHNNQVCRIIFIQGTGIRNINLKHFPILHCTPSTLTEETLESILENNSRNSYAIGIYFYKPSTENREQPAEGIQIIRGHGIKGTTRSQLQGYQVPEKILNDYFTD